MGSATIKKRQFPCPLYKFWRVSQKVIFPTTPTTLCGCSDDYSPNSRIIL